MEEIKKDKFHHRMKNRGGGEAVYALGILGALIYYITTATSFLMGLIGIFKAFFWPAFLVYHLMRYLGM